MDISTLDRTPREELIAKARALGVERPELLTRVELADEIVRRSESDPVQQRTARGWLGIARDLVASVVESGLNLPDAAAVIRGERIDPELRGPAAVATVTLAEIYAAQGHWDRALTMLEEVLAGEPDHSVALLLRERLRKERPTRAAPKPSVEDLAAFAAEAAYRGEVDGAPAELEPETEPAPGPSVDPLAANVSDLEAPTLPIPAAADSSAPEFDADLHAVADRSWDAPPTAETLWSALPEALLPELPAAEPAREKAVSESAPQTLTLVVLRALQARPRVCWELPAILAAEVGELALVCYGFRAQRDGAEKRELMLGVPSSRGSEELADFDAATLVRVALGYRRPSGFVPLAIASELSVLDGGLEVQFRPPLLASQAISAAERALVADFSR